ncbi:MAG: hypothetical protein KGJ86_22540, partial [Chloroflexota bacterium]|nr:hypothetical protein [Chloroflexota bacterium]
MANNRAQAVEAYVRSVRTGEASAAAQAAAHLAPDVVLSTGQEEIKGHDQVLARISGQWPFTPVYVLGAWSVPLEEGDKLKVSAQFSGLGAAPAALSLTFSFNSAGQISRVDQQTTPAGPMQTTDQIPDFVKGYVNSALANGTPMVVAYTDESGQPVLSLRGSTQAYSDTQLCIWLRNAEGGLSKSIAKNPKMSVLYRDSK